jgi:hypothetical protein
VEHVAGMKYENEEKHRPMFSGKINLPEQDMKFLIKIGPVVYNDAARAVCTNDINYWFKEIFEKGLRYTKNTFPLAKLLMTASGSVKIVLHRMKSHCNF